MIEEVILKFIFATILGGMIGFERELSHKPAGLRTMMFITLACTMFTIVSTFPLLSFGDNDMVARIDPGRIASNILTGLGFIGGGVIMYTRGSVSGITTASMIWCCGALGMTIGFGYYTLSILFTLIMVIIARVIGSIETKYMKKPKKKSPKRGR